MGDLPAYADLVVVGGGTSGSVLAGLIAERSDRSVLVLEAGPDYGPFAEGGWPEDLLDPRVIPLTHQWGYASAARFGQSGLALERAKVIGGCSAHNGMAAIWGHRDDYDGWAAAGNDGWETTSLLPYFAAATERLRVFTPTRKELGPFHEAVLDASEAAGLPLIDDINDLEGPLGMAVPPMNTPEGIRWNAAFGYLDPVRGRGNLHIAGETLVDRVVVEHGRASGVVCATDRGPVVIGAGEVVVAAGAYESPAILLRSGIGDPARLRSLQVDVTCALPGVGENLHDHPAYAITYAGTPELNAALTNFADRQLLREEGVIAKLRVVDDTAFDLHIYPVGYPGVDGANPYVAFPVATMTPHSRGSVRLASADPLAKPVLDHGYLTDPDDHDLRVLAEGLRVVRRLTATARLAGLVGAEVLPGGDVAASDVAAHIRANSVHYYHPVGTCKMGPANDPLAVVDHAGRVHGVQGLRVVDCSIMPLVPRANTNIPAVVIGEKIAATMLRGG